MTTIINRMQNFGVVEYLEWIRQVLGQSVYNQIMQLSPNILNFEKVITLKEQYLYGSKRLGLRKPHVQLAAAPHTAVGYQTPNEPQAPGGWFNNDCMCYTYEEPVPVGGTPPPPANTTFTARFYTHTLGKKEYEITNHASAPLSASLGNVLATVLDRKTGVKGSPTATTYAWFKADVSTAQDYYPFGSLMPGRTYVAPTGAGYRYGFNGVQRDDEIKGPGNSLDFGARMYDSRLGRLWSNDPRWREFPAWSVYSYASNSPILFIDEEGEGPGHSILKWLANETKGTWSVQAYGSISIGVVRTAAKGMAVDKYGNVALLMTSSSGWQGNSVGASAGVSLSNYPFQSARDVTGKSLSMGAQGSFFYKSLSAGATVDMGLNEKGKASGKGSITLSLGVGIEASPAAVSPVFMANNITAILLSETDFSKIENGYSQLLSRTIDLNQKKGNTGFYSPISSTLDFVPTSNEGEFEAVLRQTYEYRPFTGGAKNQVVTETISTGIRLQADDGNLRSNNLVQPSAAQR